MAPELNAYWETISAALPHFAADEQRTAVAIYRALSRGSALRTEDVASALQVDPADAEALLARPSIDCFVYRDAGGRIAGFGGLATAPMHHEFEVGGRQLWTWCAWDALFIPEILGATARVTSIDPESGRRVRLEVTPEGAVSVDPPDALVSFLLPEKEGAFTDSASTVLQTFCHHVFFFADSDSGTAWAQRHPGAFLYSVEEAFELGRRLNRKNFGEELQRLRHSGGAVLADAGGRP